MHYCAKTMEGVKKKKGISQLLNPDTFHVAQIEEGSVSSSGGPVGAKGCPAPDWLDFGASSEKGEKKKAGEMHS